MSGDYGFIGLGAMGYAMAGMVRKSLPKETTMYIYDVYGPSCERFISEFGSHGPIVSVGSAKECATEAKTVISIVPTGANVREVYLDTERGVIAAPRDSQRLILECSTIESEVAREVATELARAGQGTYIDTPVSGGVPAAEARTLSFLIGRAWSEEDDMSVRAQQCMEMMGEKKKFFWCGNLGAGLAAKISNNYISCSVLLIIAEAMAVGVRSGIDPKLLQAVIHNSTGQSFMGDHVNPVPGVVAHAPSSNSWKLGFKTQMMIKDISLGVEAAKRVGIEPRMASTAVDIWKEAAADPRCIDRDGSSVWLHINDISET